MDEIFIDLNFLTESERDQLQDVLARDDEFRRQEKRRLSDLKKDLERVKKSSAVRADTTGQEHGKVCARCHQEFGVLFNTGAFCPKCKAKVCKSCREPSLNAGWLCSLCSKVREVKAKSGAWFFDQSKPKNETRSLFGTSLIRASLKRRKTSGNENFGEIPNPPVIGLNHGKSKLHRPIPVHMSAIRERGNEDLEPPRNDNEKIINDINQNNDRPYAKAIPVKNTRDASSDHEKKNDALRKSLTKDDDEVVVTENRLIRDNKSHLRQGKQYNDGEVNKINNLPSKEEKEKDEEEMFEFLDDVHKKIAHDDKSNDYKSDDQSNGLKSRDQSHGLKSHDQSHGLKSRDQSHGYKSHDQSHGNKSHDQSYGYESHNQSHQSKSHDQSHDYKSHNNKSYVRYEGHEEVSVSGTNRLIRDEGKTKIATKKNYDVNDVIISGKNRFVTEDEKKQDEDEMFDFLDGVHRKIENGSSNVPRDMSHVSSYASQEYESTPETSLEYHSMPSEFEQTRYQSKGHLKAGDPTNRSTSISSIDSFRTANYETPTESPGHSNFNTPTQSLSYSDEEKDFQDAKSMTPVPDNDEFHSLPPDYTEPQQETIPQEAHKPPPKIDVLPPEIKTTAVEVRTPDDVTTEDPEDQLDDIDEAFAVYGSNLSLNRSKLSLDKFDMGSRESIVSYYSDAGEGHYGNIPVTGEVQFGLKYDYRAGVLEVQVHRARDIAPVDRKKKRSDPYVKVYLLPDKTKSGKQKTRTKRHTLNPEFDEILKFKIGFEEMQTRTIWLTVWNNDRFGHNDFLGEIAFPLNSYEESGFSWSSPSPQWYSLRERQREPSLLDLRGELVIALKYVPPEQLKEKKSKKKSSKGNLYVAMLEAHNLIAKDSNGFSDPFCKAYLLPDKSKKTKRKTPTIKKTLNPAWKHTIVYENLTHEELYDRVLELTVWDWDRGLSNSFLGGVRLGMGARQEPWDDAGENEKEAWIKMIDNPNEWNRFTLDLRSSMDSRA